MEVAVKETYTLYFRKKEKAKKLVASDKNSLLAYQHMLGGELYIDCESDDLQIDKEELSIFNSSKSLFDNKELLLDCFEKINLTEFHSEVKHIDKSEVHKVHQKNVMVSEVSTNLNTNIKLLSGNVRSTSEIQLDHINQEHVEAILLGELCRQSGLVCVSELLGSESEYYILEEQRKYKNIVRRDADIYIHSLPLTGIRAKGRGLCLFTIYQDNKLCVSGYYSFLYSRKR